MLTLSLIKLLPARLTRLIQSIADVIEESHTLRLKMMKTHRLGFDS